MQGSAADTAGEHTTTAVFVTVWQYWPGQGDGQEDIIVRSQIRFIQTPGNPCLYSSSVVCFFIFSALHRATTCACCGASVISGSVKL